MIAKVGSSAQMHSTLGRVNQLFKSFNQTEQLKLAHSPKFGFLQAYVHGTGDGIECSLKLTV